MGESIAGLDPAPRGAAIECRINAEDRGALPAGARPHHALRRACRTVRARRRGGRAGTRRPRRLRLHVREARRRIGRRPGTSAGACCGPWTSSTSRGAHDDPGAPVGARVQGVQDREAHDDVGRARARRGGVPGPGRASAVGPDVARGPSGRHPRRGRREARGGAGVRRAAWRRPCRRRLTPERTTSTCTARCGPRCRARSSRCSSRRGRTSGPAR